MTFLIFHWLCKSDRSISVILSWNLDQLLHNNQRSLFYYYPGMAIIIWGFFVFQILYHIFVTVLGYGVGVFSPEAIAIFRDGVWMLLAGAIFLLNSKAWRNFFHHRWKMIIVFSGLLVFSILLSRFMFGKALSEILIGIKYGLWYLCILISAGSVWYFLSSKLKTQKKSEKSDFSSLGKWQNILKWGLVSVVLLGRAWQIAKILFPDRFMAIWYGKLDDYHFWLKPPLYYLTWYEGTLRWQGLFSWPNNYGYFLVVFLPLILQYFSFQNILKFKSRKKSDWIGFLVVALWLITLWATLSRAAMIGAGVVLFCLYFPHIKKHKKILIWSAVWVAILLLGLSIFKLESTLVHIQQKLSWVLQVIHQPLWYGLGSSGPAVHHTGSFLPENFYLQLMLDLWTVGFLIWLGVMYAFLRMQKSLIVRAEKTDQKPEFLQYLRTFQIWLLALLVMGLFLHVFEDSMVNYLFFWGYGLMLWALQGLIGRTTNEKAD